MIPYRQLWRRDGTLILLLAILFIWYITFNPAREAVSVIASTSNTKKPSANENAGIKLSNGVRITTAWLFRGAPSNIWKMLTIPPFSLNAQYERQEMHTNEETWTTPAQTGRTNVKTKSEFAFIKNMDVQAVISLRSTSTSDDELRRKALSPMVPDTSDRSLNIQATEALQAKEPSTIRRSRSMSMLTMRKSKKVRANSSSGKQRKSSNVGKSGSHIYTMKHLTKHKSERESMIVQLLFGAEAGRRVSERSKIRGPVLKLDPPIPHEINYIWKERVNYKKKQHGNSVQLMSSVSLKFCPDINELTNLLGPLPQSSLLIEHVEERDVALNHPYIMPGGHWKPKNCMARYKVAIIIPFRDRQSHLTRLVDFLFPILKRQFLDFRLIVTEQHGWGLFNKGRIMNAAFRFAEKLDVDCVIFHDVDVFPQDDRIPFGCPAKPLHIGAYVNSLGYRLIYKEMTGGIFAINMDDYRTVNGYSNMYWAWGGEDDDMGKRILAQNWTINRLDETTARFTMLKNKKRKRLFEKFVYKLLDDAAWRWKIDGLNVTSWKIIKILKRPLYYHIYVDVGPAPQEWLQSTSTTRMFNEEVNLQDETTVPEKRASSISLMTRTSLSSSTTFQQ